MRLTISIDSISHNIDSTDPEVLGEVRLYGELHRFVPVLAPKG